MLCNQFLGENGLGQHIFLNMTKKTKKEEIEFPDVAATIASAKESLTTHCGNGVECECSQIVVFRQTVLDLIQIAEAYKAP